MLISHLLTISLILINSFLMQNAFARDIHLVHVYANNYVQGEHSRLELKMDDRTGNILGIIKKGVDADGKTYENFIPTNPEKLSSGVVLHTADDRDVLKLKAINNPGDIPELGGELKLVFLYNGIKGTYYSKQLMLIRKSFHEWSLTYNNAQISKLNMLINSVLGVTVGISDIKFEY